MYYVSRLALILILFLFFSNQAFSATEYQSIKSIFSDLDKSPEKSEKVEMLKMLSKRTPETREDIDTLKFYLLQKDYDEDLYFAVMKSFSAVKNSDFGPDIIEVLEADFPLLSAAEAKAPHGKSQKEILFRALNAESLLKKLGQFKNPNSSTILKKYLALKSFSYVASEAIAKIGDKSIMPELKNRAYRGEEINFAGAGLEEAIEAINDLKSETKEKEWPKIAKQIALIKNKETKPYLVGLFDHKKSFVRQVAASKFSALSDKDDIDEIVAMANNQDWFVRSAAIHAMKNIEDQAFENILMNLLLFDPHRSPRRNAAKALGFKNVKKAVPVLEKALNDDEFRVREEAFIALYLLTGQEYSFDGRNSRSERLAASQKESPTFY